jgi:hypothetical protein
MKASSFRKGFYFGTTVYRDQETGAGKNLGNSLQVSAEMNCVDQRQEKDRAVRLGRMAPCFGRSKETKTRQLIPDTRELSSWKE